MYDTNNIPNKYGKITMDISKLWRSLFILSIHVRESIQQC